MKLNLKHFSFLSFFSFCSYSRYFKGKLASWRNESPLIDYYFSLALWSGGVITYIQSFSEAF